MNAEPTAPKRKRSWFQYSLRTLLIFSCLAAVVFAWPHLQRRYRVRQLAEYADRDLRKLAAEESERVTRLVTQLTQSNDPNSPNPSGFSPFTSFETWYVWRPKSGKPFLLVFQARQMILVPGSSYARVCMLDSNGNLRSAIEFETGYRGDVTDATFHCGDPAFDYIKVQTTPFLLGIDIGWQYYAIVGNQLQLVRVEDGSGNVIPLAMEHGVGPQIARASEKEWNKLLCSAEPMKCLIALATAPRTGHDWHEAIPRETLTELSQSPNHWIADAARAYLRAVDDKDYSARPFIYQ